MRGLDPSAWMHALVEGSCDLLFPPRCAACDAFLSAAEHWLCSGCRQSLLQLAPPVCLCCGLPDARLDDGWCRACLLRPPPFLRARACAAYGGALEQVIRRLKFRREPQLVGLLLELVLQTPPAALALEECHLLLPVPLHVRRLRERGFNQSALLARGLARAWSIPVDLGALERVRDTPPQSSLPAEERHRNLLGAFQARGERVQGRDLLLLDDVITTGSTTAECSRVLLEAGARSVQVLAVARTLPERMLP